MNCNFESEVQALIDDLGLIPLESLEAQNRLAAFSKSAFSKVYFCEQYKEFLAREKRFRDSLCKELYLRNRKFSRYVRSSATNSKTRH